MVVVPSKVAWALPLSSWQLGEVHPMFSQLPSRSCSKKKVGFGMIPPHTKVPKEVSSNKLQKKITLHKTSKLDGTGSSHIFRIRFFLAPSQKDL